MTVLSRRLLQAALALAASLSLGSTALAVQYETDIDIDNEADLYDLAARQEIGADTLETLVDLMSLGVDLNAASREEIYELPGLTYEDVDAILKYREQTRIVDPADLVAANAITQGQLLQIAPFLVLGGPTNLPVTGKVRLMAGYSNDDAEPSQYLNAKYPPAFLQAKAKGPLNLSAGLAAVTTRMRLSPVSYSVDRGGLVATQPYQFNLPKFHLQWKNSMFQVVAGTFRVGFGQKLTLDNTSRSSTADGAYADNVVSVPSEDLKSDRRYEGLYVTRDFKWSDAFRGVALSARHIPLGGPELSLHAFGSYQTRSIYQYEIYDRALCEDPHTIGSASAVYPSNPCKAPQVYVADDPDSKFIYSTVTDAYDELAAGGNASVTFSPGTRLGVSGYYAADYWRDTGDIKLDFQEWSNRPYGGSFGAVGLDGAARAGQVSLFGEAARTFNAMPGSVGGGGWGGLGRMVGTIQKTHEIEASLRYYDKGFVNPLGRPIASPDEFEGQRARNEAGARVKYTAKPTEDWAVRSSVDVSVWPEDGRAEGTAGRTDLYLYLRTDFVGWSRTKISGWAEYKNHDLATGGRGQCYDWTFLKADDGTPIPCFGEFIRFAGSVRVAPLGRMLSVAAEFKYDLVDDKRYLDSFRQDTIAWVVVTSSPTDQLSLKWRLKYLNESIDNNEKDEQSLWTYLDVGYLPTSNLELHLRYDLFGYLDARATTSNRRSPIQHRFRLELEARF